MGQWPGYRERLLPRLSIIRIAFGIWALSWLTFSYANADICSLQVFVVTRAYELHYPIEMIPDAKVSLERDALISFYRHLETSGGPFFLESIENVRSAEKLNDWELFKLICAASEVIFPEFRDAEQELLNWFVLSKLGFDTRITFNEQSAFLYIHAEEELFEVPAIEDGRRMFYRLKGFNKPCLDLRDAYFLDFFPGADGKPISFEWLENQVVSEESVLQTLSFSYREEVFKMDIQYDELLARKLAELPLFNETRYFDIPMSTALEKSLIPQFEQILGERPLQTKLELLLAFTRNAFSYQADQTQFAKEKPMTPDEIFHYQHSDCEDRTILFYHLARRFIPLPFAVISFENHLTVAVALPAGCSEPIQFNGINYCVCDPTGPKNEFEPGQRPEKYSNQIPGMVKIYP